MLLLHCYTTMCHSGMKLCSWHLGWKALCQEGWVGPFPSSQIGVQWKTWCSSSWLPCWGSPGCCCCCWDCSPDHPAGCSDCQRYKNKTWVKRWRVTREEKKRILRRNMQISPSNVSDVLMACGMPSFPVKAHGTWGGGGGCLTMDRGFVILSGLCNSRERDTLKWLVLVFAPPGWRRIYS